jgi:DNA-binding CsgD family transcriptional regulator
MCATEPGGELLDAVGRARARNGREREARDRLAALHADFATLTAGGREVLSHVVEGRLNKQIAGELGSSERTVKVHRKSIMAKGRRPLGHGADPTDPGKGRTGPGFTQVQSTQRSASPIVRLRTVDERYSPHLRRGRR